jgi:hypothetical protein
VDRASASASCSTVGDPANPCAVAYTRHANAGTAWGCAKGSVPSNQMVGDPVNPSRWASWLVSTARTDTDTATSTRSGAACTRSSAVCQLGQPAKYNTVT